MGELKELGPVTLPALQSTLCLRALFLEATFADNTHPTGSLRREATERLMSMELSLLRWREVELILLMSMSTSSSGSHVSRSTVTSGSLSTLRPNPTQLTGTIKKRLFVIPTGI